MSSARPLSFSVRWSRGSQISFGALVSHCNLQYRSKPSLFGNARGEASPASPSRLHGCRDPRLQQNQHNSPGKRGREEVLGHCPRGLQSCAHTSDPGEAITQSVLYPVLLAIHRLQKNMLPLWPDIRFNKQTLIKQTIKKARYSHTALPESQLPRTTLAGQQAISSPGQAPSKKGACSAAGQEGARPAGALK